MSEMQHIKGSSCRPRLRDLGCCGVGEGGIMSEVRGVATHQGLFLHPRQSPECTGMVCRSTSLAFRIASLKLTPFSSVRAEEPAAGTQH